MKKQKKMNDKIIEEIAYHLLKKYSINKFPIDPWEIVKKELALVPIPIYIFELYIKQKLDIAEDEDIGFSIYLPNDERYGVIYNNYLPFPKKRWIIAHELGHIILNHVRKDGKPVFLNDKAVDPELDRQANIFARFLLCPEFLITFFNFDTLESIALLFDIPLDIVHEYITIAHSKNRGLINSKLHLLQSITMEEKIIMSYPELQADILLNYYKEYIVSSEQEINRKIINTPIWKQKYTDEYSDELCDFSFLRSIV